MTDTSENLRPAGFHSLPSELQHQIFKHIYPPWYFEYTQVHDSIYFFSQNRFVDATVDLKGISIFSRLPSIAPLLVCKTFHDAGRHIFDTSFTGNMHVVSGMIWKEVHWTYGCIMAKTKTLYINIGFLKSLHQCRTLDRLPKLEKIIIYHFSHYMSKLYCMQEELEKKDESIEHRPAFEYVPLQLQDPDPNLDHSPLENSELTRFVPDTVDLSDAGLRSALRNIPIFRSQDVDPAMRRVLHSMRVNVIRRLHVGVPSFGLCSNHKLRISLLLDFQKITQVEVEEMEANELREERGEAVEDEPETLDLYRIVGKRLIVRNFEDSDDED